MNRQRAVAVHASICLAAAISGIAAAYVLNEWVLRWWDARHTPRVEPDEPDDKPATSSSSPQRGGPPATVPAGDPEHADPNKVPPTPSTSQTRSLPPLRTDALFPPFPNGHALLSGSSFATIPDAMTSSTSLHTLSSQEGDEESASQSNASDTDTEPFVDLLSPPPNHVISRRRSLRNHDLFAESHISFSELGSLVAPQNGLH